MIDSEFLYSVAQVSATNAGFTTLVAVAYKGETGALLLNAFGAWASDPA